MSFSQLLWKGDLFYDKLIIILFVFKPSQTLFIVKVSKRINPKDQISEEKLVTSSTAVSFEAYLAVKETVALSVFSLFSKTFAMPKSDNLALKFLSKSIF